MAADLLNDEPLKLLTVEEVARLFQVRKRKVYELIHDEGLPHVRIGRQYRLRVSEVLDWLEARSVAAPVPELGPAAPVLRSGDWSRRG